MPARAYDASKFIVQFASITGEMLPDYKSTTKQEIVAPVSSEVLLTLF